jgi:hypothetical protein
MKHFNGFDNWIEIFKTGTHTDSEGRTKTWGDSDLEHIASSYDPIKNEAPIVIGHPETNAPAYGWVEKIKKEGASLYMKIKDAVPEFVDMVKRGLFKKRSISIFPDGTLRHVGFLGAAAPAVKGLKDIAFEEGAEGSATFEFEQESDAGENLEILIEQKMRQDENLTYTQAFSEVQKENPELAAEYAATVIPPYRNTNTRSLNFAGKALDELIRQRMEKKPDLTYAQAFAEVQKENPVLSKAYMQEISESNKAEDVAAYEFMTYLKPEEYERTLRILDLVKAHPPTDHRGSPIDWSNEPIKVAADLVDDQFPELKKRVSDQEWEALYENLKTVLGFQKQI